MNLAIPSETGKLIYFLWVCCSGEYRLTLELFRHLSTDSVEVDVQPTYVRAFINNKIFQLRYTSHSTKYIHRGLHHRGHIFTRDETGLLYLPTQLERTLQLYW
jgi:hypothetical protein